MNKDAQLKKKFHEINWNFHDALTNYSLHKFHWYPGSSIPQIPAYLIELFSKRDDVIFDPFCGSGTTLVEALRLGRKAIGLDNNDIALLISGAKTSFIAPKLLDKYYKDFSSRVQDASFQLNFNGPDAILFKQTYSANVKELKKWFHPKTFQDALLLWNLIMQEKGSFQSLLIMIFSGLQKKFSKPHKHWGYIADNVAYHEKSYVDAIGLFLNAFKGYIFEVTKFLDNPRMKNYSIAELNKRVKLFKSNVYAKINIPKESVDLIVTSPPYANVTDYIRSQRLSFYWLGLDMEDKHHEIGARWKRSRNSAIQDYLLEMDTVLVSIIRTLKPGGFFCMTIGESESKKREFDVVKNLKLNIVSKGLTIFSDEIYRTPINQRVRAQKEGNVLTENIIVFQKH